MTFSDFSYTLAVSGRLFPFLYKKFKVVKHQNEQVGDSTRLVLTLPDGSVIVIPEISKRHMKVYADVHAAEARFKKFKEEQLTAAVMPQVTVKDIPDGERRILQGELSDS